MATVTVLYKQGTEFNMDYYKKTHMPMVMDKWAQYGLKSWKVLHFGKDAPYTVQATLEFGSMDEFHKAGAGPEVKEVMDDVRNFSNTEPILMPGDVVATS